MQFFKSALFAVLAFTAVAVAVPGEACGGGGGGGGGGDGGGGEGGSGGGRGGKGGDCKPLLQSCGMNSECCGDLCVAGVSCA